jgi:hypothetical protein
MTKDTKLYKIISGRTKLKMCGLFLYVYEPRHKLIAKSYEIYEETYEQAYMHGLYNDEEIKNILVDYDIWNPLNDQEIDKLKKELEDIKVQAYESCFKTKELRGCKLQISVIYKKLAGLYSKKTSLDHLSCKYVAENSRMQWLLLHSTRLNGKKINDQDFDITKLYNLYVASSIDVPEIRELARYDNWRIVWSLNKNHGGKLFDRDPQDYSRDQLSLCSYSGMYDNVFEHPESPDEKVVNDDDCLDGWFITQKRKSEKNKKQRQTDDLIKNPKIKSAKEVFIMADNNKDAEAIQNMNDMMARSIIKQREDVINEKGRVQDTDFADIKLENSIRSQQMLSDHLRKK